LPIARPFRSRTTTGTTTRFTRVLKVVFASGEDAISTVFLAGPGGTAGATVVVAWLEDGVEDWFEDCVEDGAGGPA